LKKRIQELEKIALQLEPGKEVRSSWMREADRYAQDFIEQIEEIPAWVESLSRSRELLDFPIGEEPVGFNTLLEALGKYVDSPGLNPASGGHLAYIPGGGLYPSALADYLVDITNRYAGLFYSGPGPVRIENQLIRWMCSLMGYPEDALGNLASGGSIATLIAIATARDYKKVKAAEVERSVIYLSAQVHHCVQKAIRIAGLGEAVIRYVALDEGFRIDPQALRQQIEADKKEGLRPFLLVASVGTTDTGAVDPLEKLADIAEQEDLWLHADAAYGGFFILVDEFKDKFKGIERTDSITIDPHKGLFLPYGLGAVLVKNTEALRNTHYYKANYMQDALAEQEEPSPGRSFPGTDQTFSWTSNVASPPIVWFETIPGSIGRKSITDPLFL
jgi:aromatic-L-amino-acid decarboxylase